MPEAVASEVSDPVVVTEIAAKAPGEKSMITDEQKATIQSILSVFETGKPEGDYGAAVILADGAGISYGKHQATDAGGNLDRIVLRYMDLGGVHADALRPYLARLERNETAQYRRVEDAPTWVGDLVDLLQLLGRSDAMMQLAQDQIFDEEYWAPCVAQCDAMGLRLPLAWAVVYDTCIHSGPKGVARIRKLFPEAPPSGGGDERAWARAYVRARRNWLASYGEPGNIVRGTVVRMDALKGIMDAENWELERPIVIGTPYRVTIR